MKRTAIATILVLVALTVAACGSTQTVTDPVEVLQTFYDALDEGDLDGAMEFVADDASFVTDARHDGQADIRDVYQRFVIDVNGRHELSDFQVEGDTVTFYLKGTSDLGVFVDRTHVAVVQEGKIVSLIVV